MADFERFVNVYEAAVNSFSRTDLRTSRVRERYSNVIAPKLQEARCFLAQSFVLGHEPLHKVTEMLLGVLETTEPGSEERESLLYELGLQFIRELKAEGLLVDINLSLGSATPSPRLPIGEALAA